LFKESGVAVVVSMGQIKQLKGEGDDIGIRVFGVRASIWF
jgi:hypothetical protein